MAAVPNEAGFIRFCTVFPHSVFGDPSAQRIVGVGPSFFRAVFFEDFGLNQLVVQVVEIVLHFAVGQLVVDQVAGAVVAVAAFDGGLAITRRYFVFAFAALCQIIESGNLPFQTA